MCKLDIKQIHLGRKAMKNKYQPNGDRGTRFNALPPAKPKMAEGVWRGVILWFLGTPITFHKKKNHAF